MQSELRTCLSPGMGDRTLQPSPCIKDAAAPRSSLCLRPGSGGWSQIVLIMADCGQSLKGKVSFVIVCACICLCV